MGKLLGDGRTEGQLLVLVRQVLLVRPYRLACDGELRQVRGDQVHVDSRRHTGAYPAYHKDGGPCEGKVIEHRLCLQASYHPCLLPQPLARQDNNQRPFDDFYVVQLSELMAPN